MTTIRTICQRAVQVLGAGSGGLNRTPSDREVSAALTHLNEMMHGLNTDGAVIEWSDKALGATAPWPAEVDDLVIHALGNRLQVPLGQFPADRDLRRRLESAEPRLRGYYTPVRRYDSEYF